MSSVTILKSNGEREPFDRAKLERSLLKSGATETMASEIADHIEKELRDGMSAHDIYAHSFQLLHKAHRPSAVRYSLRRALFALGPTGFPFEEFIAGYFAARGWKTAIDQVVQGHCVDHEVDVVAWKDDVLAMCEAKFHNEPGVKSDLKVALYVKARMDDLFHADAPFPYGGGAGKKLDQFWLFTNTKFTEKAIEYGECAGLAMVGWNYPRKGNLQDLIEETGLHPITVLTTLSELDKRALFAKKVVLCRELAADPSILASIGIAGDRKAAVDAEVQDVLKRV